MKIIVAPTAFKGTLTSHQAAAEMAAAAHEVYPRADIISIPLADGGEGTTETLIELSQGQYRNSIVCGPLPGQSIDARWGILGDKETAVIEMASAAGLTLVPEVLRDPKISTTFGVGQIIHDVLNLGLRRIIIGIGDSATNDGGAGIVQALGIRFLDSAGNELPQGGLALLKLEKIDASQFDPRVAETKFILACDVTNNLWGPEGTSTIFAPQKGASPEDVHLLDNALLQFGTVLRRELGTDVLHLAGGGAGGGAAAGLVAFCQAELRRGIDFLLDVLRFDELLRNTDLVITGEGRLDYQTQYGKVIHGVLGRTRRKGVPTIAIAGSTGRSPAEISTSMNITAVYSLVEHVGEKQALRQPRESLRQTTIHALKNYNVRPIL